MSQVINKVIDQALLTFKTVLLFRSVLNRIQIANVSEEGRVTVQPFGHDGKHRDRGFKKAS